MGEVRPPVAARKDVPHGEDESDKSVYDEEIIDIAPSISSFCEKRTTPIARIQLRGIRE